MTANSCYDVGARRFAMQLPCVIVRPSGGRAFKPAPCMPNSSRQPERLRSIDRCGPRCPVPLVPRSLVLITMPGENRSRTTSRLEPHPDLFASWYWGWEPGQPGAIMPETSVLHAYSGCFAGGEGTSLAMGGVCMQLRALGSGMPLTDKIGIPCFGRGRFPMHCANVYAPMGGRLGLVGCRPHWLLPFDVCVTISGVG